ncbi:MAG TPA: STAS domain-containing protein [Burkholderiaceae bacterium]
MERIPILNVGPVLLVSLQIDMHDRMALALQDDLTRRIGSDGATGVVIDISALDLVDSFIGRIIGTTASMAALLGAPTVLAGMRPSVAITLVELGMHLSGLRTALSISHGLEMLKRSALAELAA